MPYQNVTPTDAKALLDGDEDWTYLDVRTVEEFEAGHPTGAYNIPIATRTPDGAMAPNAAFVSQVKKHFPKEAQMILGCAAGGRSRHACEQLLTDGYRSLVNMHGGFSGARDETGRTVEEGWQACGFPVETSCEEVRTWRHLSSAT
jgi:rhodanese-related sulfurtransferase